MEFINKIICGDCLELMPKIPDGIVNMILCDLPYGVTACEWDIPIPLDQLWKNYRRIAKDNAAIVLTASQPFTSQLVMSNLEIFKYELVWDKTHGKAPGVAKLRPLPSHENILVFGKAKTIYNPQMEKGEAYKDKRSKISLRNKDDGHKLGYKGVYEIDNKGTRYPKSVLVIPVFSKAGKEHPSQKPVDLFEYLIKTYTNRGDLVLDNCIGSGTTAVACKNLDRKYIGIDISENYCNIARRRLEETQRSLDNEGIDF